MNDWLLFTYKVPNSPSAPRVYVWRKLKALGALLHHDSTWVLPATPTTQEKLQWLAAEVREMKSGEATLWEARQLFTGEDSDLLQQFKEQADASYLKLLDELERNEADLEALAKQYQQIKQMDYFQSDLGKRVLAAIIRRREGSSS